MDKEDTVHIYSGILLSHKNEQNNVGAFRDHHRSGVRQRNTIITCYHLYA